MPTEAPRPGESSLEDSSSDHVSGANQAQLLEELAKVEHELETLAEYRQQLREKIEGMEGWLSDARALAGEIESLVAKRDALRALALPQSEDERRAERESHPDFGELERVEGELVFRRRALEQRRDGKEAVR